MREKLEGYTALECGVLGPIDGTHPAFAEFLEDLVLGDGLADHAESLLKHVLDKHEL